MGNRRERRAQASSSAAGNEGMPSMRASDDPRNKVKPAKTLLEIAAERQTLKSHLPAGASLKESNVVNVTIDDDGTVRTLDGSPLPEGLSTKTKDGKVVETSGEDNEEPIPPVLDTLLLSLPLSFVHFTLAVLCMYQYAQELKFPPLLRETALRAFPTLTLLIHLFHGHLLPLRVSESVRTAILVARSICYLVTANVAGCYLIVLANDRGYYAVMKNAPGVGTLWVFAVLEMGLLGAILGVAGPGFFMRFYGYKF